ncbi:MAG: oxidoreductase [Neomegalonema sp.]|nr:oxidoreductase [Neomegalonema sp.]
MPFNALLLEKLEDGPVTANIRTIEESALPEDGEVLVAVEYSTLNYKDGLCIGGLGGLVRQYPHVPGIDFAGTVESSADPRYKPGDKVVLTGWRVGEIWWGGFAQKAKVKADWLVPLPPALSSFEAMAVGTAGLTAMLGVMALEDHGLTPAKGPVLITGAAGGVGSVATAILAKLGYEVAAVTGRPEATEALNALGASQIVAREQINETVKRPLEKESWAGCIDSVGGAMLARVLGQMQYGASVAAIGLAGGAQVPANIMPFLLRGVNLLGIDSVMQPFDNRIRAWNRIMTDLPMDKLMPMVSKHALGDLIELGPKILAGQIKGRAVIDVNA